jgi:Protein of unknown function (DUF4238)
MGGRDHYISQFHLRGFTDLLRVHKRQPWLWVGNCGTHKISRRAPKNLAWSRGMFAGPGGLADQTSSLETFLSREVESPAAKALVQFAKRPVGRRGPMPGEILRYIAWAAARSLSMRQLFEAWIRALPPSGEVPVAEPPPEGFQDIRPIVRLHRMKDREGFVQEGIPSDQVRSRREEGWELCLGVDDFLDLAHAQAWYFQVRMFPRLQWEILDAPPGKFFIIADRPVVWGFQGLSIVKPSALRDPSCQLVAPLTRSLALFAFHASAPRQESITPEDINRISASGAHEWIAGPTEDTVAEALASKPRGRISEA